ncbi:2-phosphosulfolactate phosphatase [Actinoplanes sp. NPDC049265]|uniref:2-phosphosulfolactate phosphatase n=1 Tax=Actinoplanes sp. NPDC049265 TaxID=3363902 RepID=UPI0037198A60
MPEARIRFEWGLTGGRAVSAGADIVVVVDVLSFTTSVSVALDAGMVVLPYRWNDGTAARFAQERKAALAVGRRAAGPRDFSLSPVTLRRWGTPGARVVLPSPNGSTIALALGCGRARVVAAALRNAPAVARWISAQGDVTVAVVAGGEHWPDGTLRPAVEDLWGAAAVLRELDLTDASPEARTAAAAQPGDLAATVSGRELINGGFPHDVAIAAEAGSSAAVPVLVDGEFRLPEVRDTVTDVY